MTEAPVRAVQRRWSSGQSLVEFALIAPILILLAMAVWDGGSVLRDRLVLQQAARDGARMAVTTWVTGVAPRPTVETAVTASAGDLGGLLVGARDVDVVPGVPPQSILVRVRFKHPLLTPMLRNLWGEGTVDLQESATFYLPPIPVSRLAVVASSGRISAGTPMSVTVTVQDQYGPAPAYVGTVHFTSTDGLAGLPANYTFLPGDNGSHTFTNLVTLRTAGTQTVSATDVATSVSGTSGPIVVGAAAATKLLVVPSVGTVTAGTPMSVTVTAQDASNGTVSGYLGTVHFTSTDVQAGLPANYTFVAADNGVHVFTNLLTLKTVGSQRVTATDTLSSITGVSAPIAVTAAPATKLLVTASAPTVVAGTPMSVTVTAQDASNGTVSGYLGTVHFTSTDVQAGLPANYTFVAADNGVHVFSNLLTLKTVGSQTVTATDTVTSTISGTTNPISVTPGAATRLVFTTQPVDTVAGTGVNPAIVVQVQDAAGNVVSTSTAPITISIAANPGSGTLGGTPTVNAVNGVATFSGLSIDRTGLGYTLTAASAGLPSTTSSAFNILVGAASKLVFSVQPSTTQAGASIAPSVQVTVQEASGNTVTSSSAPISLSIGTNPGGGTLAGTTTVNAASGIASFGNLSINLSGTGYTLKASSGTLTGVTSTSFNVLSPPTPTPSPTVQATATPIAANIPLDDTDARWTYNGSGWQRETNCPPFCPVGMYAGTLHYTNTPGDSATITLNGNQIRLYAATSDISGIAGVRLDGGPETNVDLSSNAFPGTGNNLVWSSGLLPWGLHTLVVRNTGNSNSFGNYISIDRLDLSTVPPPTATPTPTPVPTPSACPNEQFLGRYYAGFNNGGPTGAPVATDCEPRINYDWTNAAPFGLALGSDYSVRWTGQFTFVAGSYTFSATADDGVRVWYDGGLIIDQWQPQAPTTYTARIAVTSGLHQVRVEYYETAGGQAVAKVSWSRP